MLRGEMIEKLNILSFITFKRMQKYINIIIHGDCLEVFKKFSR